MFMPVSVPVSVPMSVSCVSMYPSVYVCVFHLAKLTRQGTRNVVFILLSLISHVYTTDGELAVIVVVEKARVALGMILYYKILLKVLHFRRGDVLATLLLPSLPVPKTD